MTPEFDWQAAQDEGAIVQQAVERGAVYENPYGDLVVRQERGEYDEHDTYIVIARGNLPAFIAKLQELVAEDSARPEPLSAAERQRRYRQRHRNGERDEDVTAERDAPLLAAE